MPQKVLMKGNEAIAEAAIMAGCRLFFGYPITPQSEISEYFAKRMPKVGGLFLQAESEIASINMVLGAAAAGARVMTSSSSPGISLMAEGISYIAGSDLPCVLVNVQRAGPGLGGIQPGQADYSQAVRGVGHGDLRIIVLAPASVQELAECTREAFDMADQYRMPVMILADGALGQMMEPLSLDFEPARALPPKTWAARGHAGARPHNVINSLIMDTLTLEKVIRARFDRYRQIEQTEARFESELCDDAELIVTAYGITARVAKTAVRRARQAGLRVGYLRPRTLWPFPKDAFMDLARSGHVKKFLACEMSMGQYINDVRAATEYTLPVEFYGRTGGVVPNTDEVLEKIKEVVQ